MLAESDLVQKMPEGDIFLRGFPSLFQATGGSYSHNWLVVSDIFYFPYFSKIYIFLPIDELIFFKMVIAPPTR
jgi:hypothetical protein